MPELEWKDFSYEEPVNGVFWVKLGFQELDADMEAADKVVGGYVESESVILAHVAYDPNEEVDPTEDPVVVTPVSEEFTGDLPSDSFGIMELAPFYNHATS